VRRTDRLLAQKTSLGLWAIALPLVALLWILFVGGVRRDEMIAGVGVLLLSGGFLYQVWRTETLNLNFDLKDVVRGWLIPWYLLTDSCVIIAVFAMDLIGIRRAGSFYRVSRLKTRESDPRLVARRVLATFYSTMAPNSIIIGVDPRQNRILFHQLKRSSISTMTQALGAEPGSRRL
jgi:hypothetical protein